MPLHDVSQQGAEAVDATLAGDVTMVSADTFYDGPSAAFAPGTWLVLWKCEVQVVASTAQTYWWTGRLWNGSTAYDENEMQVNSTISLSGTTITLAGFAVVTLTAATTLKLSVAPGRGSSSSVMKRDATDNSLTPHTATRLSAIKVA